MNRAIIYTRVSSDDQVKGYSLSVQSDMIKQYCSINHLSIAKTYTDDGYSAKTFDRPHWQELTADIKANSTTIDQVLVLRWDRFARNAEQALRVIREFKAMGVAINAIQQPLDYSSPEHKILLNIYLTIPEVENDKLSIRTKEGMEEATRQGYFVTRAPLGYKNTRTEDGKATVSFSKKAPIIEYIFKEFARGIYSQRELRIMVRRKYGEYISRNNMQKLLRHPAYAGKVRDRDGVVYEGIHHGIVDLDTFQRVQDILTGRKVQRFHRSADENLVLRGHLICPECNRTLTGSASKGRSKKYYYYHCISSCGVRYSAPEADDKFLKYLRSFSPSPEVKKLYTAILTDLYKEENISNDKELDQLQKDILKTDQLNTNAQDAFFDGTIDKEVFKEVSKRYAMKLEDLKNRYNTTMTAQHQMSEYISSSISLVERLDYYYYRADLDTKNKIIGSIFPESLYLKDGNYRTTKMNEAISLLYGLKPDFSNISVAKKGTLLKVSPMVAHNDKISNHFTKDLILLHELYLHLQAA